MRLLCWRIMRRRIAFGVMRRGRRPRFPCAGLGGAGAVVHAVLTRQARDRDPEGAQLGGGKLEAGKERRLFAGHVIGLRRIGAAVNRRVTRTLGPAPLSGKGWFPDKNESP